MHNGSTVRRSRSVVCTFAGDRVLASDFLSGQSMWLSEVGLLLLRYFAQWRDLACVLSELSQIIPSTVLEREATALLAMGLLVPLGSPAGQRDLRYEAKWMWGEAAAFYHFSIKYTRYLSGEETARYLSSPAGQPDDVPLFETNRDRREVVELPHPNSHEMMELMRRRRSYRGFGADVTDIVTQEQIADCLFSGLGIVGRIRTEIGVMPLTMTPSAGARNPFEAYLVAYRVSGLSEGVYHYSGLDHSLGRIGDGAAPHPPALLGGQDWLAGAAGIVLLVAHFERTAAKYRHATGFRVVLLEAGHIAQNILLTATSHGLACVPTCAINDLAVDSLLDLDPMAQSAVYAIALGTSNGRPTIADVVMESTGVPPSPVHARQTSSGRDTIV